MYKIISNEPMKAKVNKCLYLVIYRIKGSNKLTEFFHSKFARKRLAVYRSNGVYPLFEKCTRMDKVKDPQSLYEAVTDLKKSALMTKVLKINTTQPPQHLCNKNLHAPAVPS